MTSNQQPAIQHNNEQQITSNKKINTTDNTSLSIKETNYQILTTNIKQIMTSNQYPAMEQKTSNQ